MSIDMLAGWDYGEGLGQFIGFIHLTRSLVILLITLITPMKAGAHELKLWQMGAAYKTYALSCEMHEDDFIRFNAVLHWELNKLSKEELKAYKKSIKEHTTHSKVYSCGVLRDQLYFEFFGTSSDE